MIPKEIFKKIKNIEIHTSRLVSDVFAGQYHSVFKGQGIEFDEVREYQPGDDIRMIDWNVTARTGKAHVKKFIEERELTVMILVDISASTHFSSQGALKSQIAAELSAIIALSAIRNQDKVGVVMFSEDIELFIPPRKGKSHVLRMIRDVLYLKPKGHRTDIVKALEYLNRVNYRRAIVFLISDFMFFSDTSTHQPRHKKQSFQFGDDVKKILSYTNRRHDLIAMAIDDPRELQLPDEGLYVLEDAETGAIRLMDAGDATLRKEFQDWNQKRMDKRQQIFRAAGIDVMDISTDQSYIDVLVRFFKERYRRGHLSK